MLTLPDEEMDLSPDQTARDINLHGKIRVAVFRRYHTQPTQLPGVWTGYDPPDTHVSSKTIVKVNHVSHAIE